MVTFCSSLLIIFFTFYKQKAVLLRRILFILAVLYGIRTLSMLFTQLPSGYNNNSLKCKQQLNRSERTIGVYFQRIFVQFIHIGLQVNKVFR